MIWNTMMKKKNVVLTIEALELKPHQKKLGVYGSLAYPFIVNNFDVIMNSINHE